MRSRAALRPFACRLRGAFRLIGARRRGPARRRSLRAASAAALVAAVAVASCSPPERAATTECVAPAAAGGGWDLTCRLATTVLNDLGLVEGTMRTVNLPGAGGGIAYAFAVAERADDPGLIVAASPGTTLRLAQRQFGPLRVDQVRWIGGLGAEFGVVAVAADAPWRTLTELLDAWRAAPESLVASGGSAVVGQDHVKLLLLARAAGIEPRSVRYVPFDGGGEALTALLGGFVQIFSGDASEVEAQIEAGNVRVLAVLAPDRLGGWLADVPTAREAGFPVEWITWRGFFAPGDISDAEYDAWVERLRTVGESEAWAEALARSGLRPWLRTGEGFERFVEAQVSEFEGLARELGLVR